MIDTISVMTIEPGKDALKQIGTPLGPTSTPTKEFLESWAKQNGTTLEVATQVFSGQTVIVRDRGTIISSED